MKMKKNKYGGEAMKEILNPIKKTKDKIWNKKNLEDIKIIKAKNLKNKEQKEIEKEKIVKNSQYKLDIFKNIPSKLKENTKNWITNEQTKNKPIHKNNQLSKIRTKSQKKPLTSSNTKKPFNVGENIYMAQQNEHNSMFEKYYANKLRSKSPMINIKQNQNIEKKDDENIMNINNNINENLDRNEEVEKLINDYKEKYGTDEELEKMISQFNQDLNKEEAPQEIHTENENLPTPIPKMNVSTTPNNGISTNQKKDVHKAPTPTIKDAPIILPKIQKNYIKENRDLVIDNKIPTKNKICEDKNDIKHKDYGKVPSYIKKYELERELKKEEIKKQEEMKKYPKGTKLLSEEERINTLNGLINSKKEMENLLEKFPITTRTLSLQNKKEELIKKIEEVEKAIDMFSKKQVFIKG